MKLFVLAAVAMCMAATPSSAQLGSPSRSSPLRDAPKPYVGTRIIEDGKQRYRVTIKDSGEVVVASKAILVRRNVQMHEAMLAAVSSATGCVLGQQLWEGNTLHGKLDCPSDTPAAAEASQ